MGARCQRSIACEGELLVRDEGTESARGFEELGLDHKMQYLQLVSHLFKGSIAAEQSLEAIVVLLPCEDHAFFINSDRRRFFACHAKNLASDLRLARRTAPTVT